MKLKRKDKIGLFFFLAFVVSTSLIWFFEERFNQEVWLTDVGGRYKMLDDILENKYLLGKTKQEVIVLLGKPDADANLGDNYFVYRLGEPPSFFDSEPQYLVVTFSNNKVVKLSKAVD
ncbi:outer membrane protein assembly factor BamE domain-containing protein [Winogradskyella haliclonae]|uniref:Outer membrane protein assembly factor BamE domain-containing protein n=1 Tax=Winogradskyella haliclonae TaxID=2048558 RepID=A0ABQ2BTX3_9FLAO|nr:outer membrane protein assembly factor BamE [Winogradskyella haliclonae]GGI55911.1 hypothetical protein GCM10011444_02200 [Winogradskyella haliclonae]